MKRHHKFRSLILWFVCCFVTAASTSQQLKLMLPIGHTNSLNTVDFSPDGKSIVTSAEDNSVKLWNVVSGALLCDLNNYSIRAVSAYFSPDGKTILSAGDSAAGIWDAATGRLVFMFPANKNMVSEARFSANGKRIMITSLDSTLTIWDAFDRHLIAAIKDSFSGIKKACFSPDGKKIVTLSGNSTIEIRDAEDLKLFIRLNGDIDVKKNSCFSPDGKKLVTLSEQDTVKIYDTEKGDLLIKLQKDLTIIKRASFSPDGNVIVTIGEGSPKIWDAVNGSLLSELKGHSGLVTEICYSSEGSKMATGSYDHSIRVWSVPDGKPLGILNGHRAVITGLCFSPDGKSIATASRDHSAKVFDLATRSPIADMNEHNSLVSAHLSPDGKRMVTTAWGSEDVLIWDEINGALLCDLRGKAGWVTSACFSPDSTKLITAATDKTAKIWDVKSGKCVFELRGHQDHVSSAGFSPNGKKIVTSSMDCTAKVWDLQSEKCLLDLKGHRKAVNSASFSADGTKIITASADHTCKIWDAGNGKLLTIFKEQAPVNSACFSPDGSKVVTTSDSLIGLWDITNSKSLLCLKGHRGAVNNACFSPDGKKIVSASWDSTIKIWDVETGALLPGPREKSYPVQYACFSQDGDKIIASYKNNTTKIWDARSGNQLSTFFAVDSEDYFIQIPAGYYMCTPNAARLLHYVTPDLKVITFEQLDIKYNRPDKVLEAIGWKDTILIQSYRTAYNKRIKKLSIDTAGFRISYSVPEADFANRDTFPGQTPNETIQLAVQAADSTYPLAGFNIRINGVPVYGLKGVDIRERGSKSFDTLISIKLSQGENAVETAIINTNGTESYRKPLYIRYQPSIPVRERTYFIGIGIDHFADSSQNLNWGVKDIRDLSTAIKKKYGDVEIDTLFNKDVTLEKVKPLKKVLENSTVNDKVIIAYSGHGVLSTDYDYYLSSYDIDFAHPEKNGIPYDELQTLLDSIPARKKLMFIDACHSGEVDKEEMLALQQVRDSLNAWGVQQLPVSANRNEGKIGMKNSFELMQELFANVAKGTGATVISAAAGSQYSIEKNYLKNGTFTFSILEFMQQYEHATVNEIKKYVNHRVAALTRGLQVPTTRDENIQMNWQVW